MTFFFGRVIFQIYLIWFYACDWLTDTWYVREDVPYIYKCILVEMAAAVGINVVLNLYWSFLMLKQGYKIFVLGESDDSYIGNDEDGPGPNAANTVAEA